MRKPYRTDLTDAQWKLIKPLIPPAKPGGRPREIDMREVLNTLRYQARTGCQWDMLPHDLLPKSSVYDYFAQSAPTTAPGSGWSMPCSESPDGRQTGAHTPCRLH